LISLEELEHLEGLITERKLELAAINARIGRYARDQFGDLLGEVRRQHDALSAINDIRNSIVGYQSVNWSAHIYPLVKILNEVGIDGQGYEEAQKEAETQLQLIEKLEKQRDEFAKELVGLADAGILDDMITDRMDLVEKAREILK